MVMVTQTVLKETLEICRLQADCVCMHNPQPASGKLVEDKRRVRLDGRDHEISVQTIEGTIYFPELEHLMKVNGHNLHHDLTLWLYTSAMCFKDGNVG